MLFEKHFLKNTYEYRVLSEKLQTNVSFINRLSNVRAGYLRTEQLGREILRIFHVLTKRAINSIFIWVMLKQESLMMTHLVHKL